MAEPAEHVISYFGGKKSGYGWECSCGDGSSRLSLQIHGKIVPWEDAFDRTCESHDHLEEMGLPIPRFRS